MHERREKDACGVGFVANIKGRKSHDILRRGLEAVISLTHRGAIDADARTGDGAGVLTQIPYKLFQRELKHFDFTPEGPGSFGVAVLFLPRQDPLPKERCMIILEESLAHFNLNLIGFRPVPVDTSHLGDKAAEARPDIVHAFIARPREMSEEDFERTLYLARREIELHVARKGISDFYIPSMSCRTIVYKGMFVAPQLGAFYQDLQDPAYETAFCMFHQRYSTNTFPNWQLAQPFRMLAHNGEINTLEGNRNWMRAKEAIMESPLLSPYLKKITPIIQPDGSDSQSLDNVMELLVMAGRDLLQVACMLVPEAWRNVPDMDEELKAFYEFHETIMEPWDGPAALAFTDGRGVAACLDRNGLRPARYILFEDDTFLLGSEVGIVSARQNEVKEKGRLGPGQIIAVDVNKGKLLKDREIKENLSKRRPYKTWIKTQMQYIPRQLHQSLEGLSLQNVRELQKLFYYTQEDLQLILRPMAKTGKEPTWSMGDDTPLSFLNPKPKLIYTFFKQRFAQVTNPPIDPLREEIVMSLHTFVGKRLNFLDETARHAHLITFESPVITVRELEYLKHSPDPYFRHAVIPCVYSKKRSENLRSRVEAIAQEAVEHVREGRNILILSDRMASKDNIPVPMPLACGAVHHQLIREGLRMHASIICEAGDARETHHFAVLLGYGATLICPYLALASVISDPQLKAEGITPQKAICNYLKAAEQGILKIMSKMGISTLSSYRGAQIFEIIGLTKDVIDLCFANTPCRISGASFAELQKDLETIHREAFEEPSEKLVDLGSYRFRKWGEYHASYPPAIKKLHLAVRNNDYGAYKEFAKMVNERPLTTLRDLFEFKAGHPVPLSEVEPVESIFKRFATGSMSYGALSPEAHETIAIAMNRIGAKSGSGEGGEAPERFLRRPNGDWANSAIKQVASGRFGVTPAYLASAKEIEIKMAQGSKPGEGGQLPGHKVTPEIARLRFSMPGVTLISPPPHHDIYSIEDLAQLIYDLKQANPLAKVAVKLVAIAGVGTIAAGVVKAYADIVQISGCDGGTGASPASSIKHAGVPWEIGLAETQQTLVHNGLRGRVTVRVDGGLRTGRDVVIAAMLGADEFGFGTIAMIAEGCVMARQCHINTCPVGVATQREDLRAKFPGKPEHVVNYFTFVAQEIREILASLGFRSLDEIIGRVDLLEKKAAKPAKASEVDVSFFLTDPDPLFLRPRKNKKGRNDRMEYSLDSALIQDAREAIVYGRHVELKYPISNTHRSVGTRLSGHIAYFYGQKPMPGSIKATFYGTSGQSFGAFLTQGVSLYLYGDANDYVGKGLGGGEIVIRPPSEAKFKPDENVIVGNTCFYGATGGKAFICGRAGERFCVRNSGAQVVVEGVGDHGCEYMTGGVVVILGSCGRNFGAGMTGGVAYVLDENNTFSNRVNFQIVEAKRITDEEDIKLLKSMLREHVEKTESPKARKILDYFDEYLPLFWKVAPPEPDVAEARAQGKIEERA